MGNLLLSVLVVVLILGGPLTLYFVIRILNHTWGGLRIQFSRVEGQPLALFVGWDNESFDIKISRVKIEMTELVPGGRSLAHSFTFEDSSAKRKSFIMGLKISPADVEALTDAGLGGQTRALNNSTVNVEVETVDGETRRFKMGKKKLRADLGKAIEVSKDIELVPDVVPDSWSVQSRVFPWRKKEEVAEDGAAPKAHAPAPSGPRAPVDFTVTKVWIEPGCIVCDACEAEAPLVFHVLADTCIVRENAPLDDAAAIKAAADGCPVDVIKYTKGPKAG